MPMTHSFQEPSPLITHSFWVPSLIPLCRRLGWAVLGVKNSNYAHSQAPTKILFFTGHLGRGGVSFPEVLNYLPVIKTCPATVVKCKSILISNQVPSEPGNSAKSLLPQDLLNSSLNIASVAYLWISMQSFIILSHSPKGKIGEG